MENVIYSGSVGYAPGFQPGARVRLDDEWYMWQHSVWGTYVRREGWMYVIRDDEGCEHRFDGHRVRNVEIAG